MRESDIPGVDLNLLGPLAALLRERHVSRAADRARMSQSAMSRALSALRRIFGDELLVRGGGGYRLTPRAERLQRDLAAILPQLESLFAEAAYDPLSAAHAFRLAATDYVLSVIGAPLARRVLSQSPASTLHFAVWNESVYSDVERGAVDIAFTGGAAPPPLRSEPLFDDRYVCVMSAGHALAAARSLTLEDYLACDHVVVDVLAGRQGTIDTRLDALGRPRRASITVRYHAFAASVIRDTHLIATLPLRFAGHLSADRSLSVAEAPAEIGTLSFSMAWHPRVDGDPAHQWLRDSIRAATPTS
jgi:DNA-binding transcriptional LysR family regulator